MKSPIYKYRMFGYKKQLLPNAHLASLEEGVTTIEEARKKTGATIGYPGWGLIYNLLLSHLDRDREEIIIETGTNWGCTTIILAQALKDAGCKGCVYTVEIDPKNIEIAKRNVKQAGLQDYVRFFEGSSLDMLPNMIEKAAPCRFAFLDASHRYQDIMGEFGLILPHITDDAIVLFDNTYDRAEPHENKRVNGALKTILVEQGGNLVNLEFVSWSTPGLAIWQKTPNL